MMPVVRDPDGFIYYKGRSGWPGDGGFEPKARAVEGRPDSGYLSPELLGEDWTSSRS